MATKKNDYLNKFKSLSLDVVKGRQSIDYREVLELETDSIHKQKLKIEMKSDSIDYQSYARISVWNGKEWSHLDSIHYTLVNFKSGLCHSFLNETASQVHQKNVGYFKQDQEKLLKRAYDILV